MTRLHGRYMSVSDAALSLGVSASTVRRWCAEGRLRVKPKRKAKADYKVVRKSVESLKLQREGR